MSGGRTRRAIVLATAAVLVVVLLGATYQGVMTSIERRQYPFPGRLVDAGGHQLHLFCSGSGIPTVVLEAPEAAMSAAWGWVQPAIGARTRVCSYDRAGLGWSETGDTPYGPDTAAQELESVLTASGEPGPYLVVGQGLGAAFARIHASRLGARVAGLVLIDPPDGASRPAERLQLLSFAPWLARTGLLRFVPVLTGETSGLPPESAGALSTFLNRPDHLARAAREVQAWDAIVARAAAPLPEQVSVIEEPRAGSGRLGILANRQQARDVSVIVLRMVDDVRRANAAN